MRQDMLANYTNHLQTNLLPFWENAIDLTYGGIFTCYTNDGKDLLNHTKYVWSQGRFLWLCCHLEKLKKKGSIKLAPIWSEAIEKTYRFLTNNARMSNNHIVYALERKGGKIAGKMDRSIFADCFYVLGCNAYAQFKQDSSAFKHSLQIYQLIKIRIKSKDFNTDPYPIEDGYRSHSIPMILINTAQELYDTASKFGDLDTMNNLKHDMSRFLKEIVEEFSTSKRIRELITHDPNQKDTLLTRHINPGHTLESIWFMIHSLSRLDLSDEDKYINQLTTIARATLSKGWDQEYGGLFRFVDKTGGIPKGEEIGTPFESLVKDTWDTKLWWPHSESLYTTLLLYDKTKDDRWLNWYNILEKYVFQTFPNSNKTIGEWIQIRDRKGQPLEKVVALPVKDPFHIIRNFILIIRLLERIN